MLQQIQDRIVLKTRNFLDQLESFGHEPSEGSSSAELVDDLYYNFLKELRTEIRSYCTEFINVHGNTELSLQNLDRMGGLFARNVDNMVKARELLIRSLRRNVAMIPMIKDIFKMVKEYVRQKFKSSISFYSSLNNQ